LCVQDIRAELRERSNRFLDSSTQLKHVHVGEILRKLNFTEAPAELQVHASSKGGEELAEVSDAQALYLIRQLVAAIAEIRRTPIDYPVDTRLDGTWGETHQ
jgi:hypothetical protein